jgi:hypothetical protein
MTGDWTSFFTVWFWRGDHWFRSCFWHQKRETAVLSQQHWEYAEATPTLVLDPGSPPPGNL